MRPFERFTRPPTLWSGALVLLAGLTAGLARAETPDPPSAPSAQPAPSAAPSSAPVPASQDREAEARDRFQKGVKLFHAGVLGAALAEFLASRELYPTRSSTENAAVCLKKLGRFDEALDLYEILLRDFPDLPEPNKTSAQRALTELQGLVGSIEVTGAEPGAALAIDGRSRGELPSIGPLRVPAGTHVVRVHKEGFEPFEARVDVAGGATVRMEAKLRALRGDTSAVERDEPLANGQRDARPVAPDRDSASDIHKKPARFSIEIAGAFLMTPSFGGPIAGGSGPAFSRGLGAGGLGALRGGYALGSGFGFGLSAGLLAVFQSVEGRAAQTTAGPSVTVSDALALRGMTVGAWAGFSFGERFPIHLRLGAGALIGSAGDARTFDPSEVVTFEAGSSASANFFSMSPEVRAAIPIGDHVEISAGLEAMVLIGLSTPKWDEALEVELAGSQLGTFGPEALAGRVLVLFAPGVGVKYIF